MWKNIQSKNHQMKNRELKHLRELISNQSLNQEDLSKILYTISQIESGINCLAGLIDYEQEVEYVPYGIPIKTTTAERDLEIESLKDEIKNTKSALSECMDELHTVSEICGQRSDKIRELNRIIREKDESIVALDQMNRKLSFDYQKLQNNYEELQENLNNLGESDVEDLESEIDDLKHSVSILRDERDEYMSSNRRLSEEIEVLENSWLTKRNDFGQTLKKYPEIHVHQILDVLGSFLRNKSSLEALTSLEKALQ